MRTNCISIHVDEMTLHNAGSSAGFNIALKREGGKRIKKREKEIITTQGIRIWSPIQVLTPPNRA